MLNVCLVGIDGLRFDMAFESELAPNLSALANAGYKRDLTMEVPTISGPGWSSILTGAEHSEHMVIDNHFVGSRLGLFPDFLSLAFYKDQRIKTLAAAGWPPLVDPAYEHPVISRRPEQELIGLHRLVVRDGETYGYLLADQQVVDAACHIIAEWGPNMSFVYLCGVDEAGHIYGGLSDEYRAAVRRADAHLGTVVRTIKWRMAEFGETWVIGVTTDHGHLDDGGHGGGEAIERASFFVVNGLGSDIPKPPEAMAPTNIASYLLSIRGLD